MAENALIIKGRFHFRVNGYYGVFAVIFDRERKAMVEDYIYASRFQEIFQNDIKAPWHIFEIHLNRIQLQGLYASSITGELQQALKERFDPNYGVASGVVVDYELRNREKIYATLEEILLFSQKDRSLSLELAYEVSDLEAIMASRTARIEEETRRIEQSQEKIQQAPQVFVSQDTIIIPANPVLSPVKGVSASDITPGEQILMRLDLTMPQGSYWAQILKAYDPQTKDPLPLVATVEQVGPIINKGRDIVVNYGASRVTRFRVESAIKLKIYDVLSRDKVVHPHLIESPLPDAVSKSPHRENAFRQNVLPWLLFGLVTSLAVIIIISLVLSF